MTEITNRTLEKSTKFTHTQIKRWAVAFLPPDKASGQHSGIPRTYTFEDAVNIYLGGYLVENLRFTITEAKQVLKDIIQWIQGRGWKISEWVEFRKSKFHPGYVAHFNFPWVDLIIDIAVGHDGRIFYIAKIVHEKRLIKKSNLWNEKYAIEHFGRLSPISLAPFRSIRVRGMLHLLASLIADRANE